MKKVFFILIISTIYLILYTNISFAEKFTVGVSPPLTIIRANKDTTARSLIKIENFTEETVTFSVSYREFTASKDADGQISFVSQSAEFTELLPYISLLLDNHPVQRFALSPGQKLELRLQIILPENTASRDYYFSILFTQVPVMYSPDNEEDSFSQIIGSIGTNVLLSVNADIKPQAIIEEFSTQSFVQQGPVPFSLKVRNPGVNLITPSGTIKIHNMFGQLVGKVDLEDFNVLSKSSRYYSQSNDLIEIVSESNRISNAEYDPLKVYWPEKLLLGPYQASLDLSLSESESDYTRKIYFFALPYQAGIIFAVIVVLILIIRMRVKRYLSS